MRGLATVQGLLGRLRAGIFNKREDSLCGCFVAVKLSEFGTELMVSDFQMAKKTKHPNVNFEIQNYGLG